MHVAEVKHHAELFFDGLLVGDVVEAEHVNRTGVAVDHVEDEFDEGGFAGAVRADQSHDVALGQVEGHVVQREAGIIVFGDVGDLQRHRVGFGYGGHVHGPFLRLFLAVFLFEHAVQCVQRNAGGFGAPACLGQAFTNLGFELTLHQFVALVHHESAFALNVLYHALIGQFVVRPGDGEYGDAQLLGEFPQGRQGLARLQLAAEHRRTDLGFDLLVDGFTGHG